MTLVRVAQDQVTPAVSSVARSLGQELDREDAATVADFERGLAEIPEVRHAERLFGDPDYLLRVATADIAAYQTLRDTQLATLPGVGRLTSTIVMKRIVEERPFYPASLPSAATQALGDRSALLAGWSGLAVRPPGGCCG